MNRSESDPLHGPLTTFFQVNREADGTWRTGHGESYFANTVTDEAPIFTVSNGALLACTSPAGVLEHICVFGPTRMKFKEWPGGWVGWSRNRLGPLTFILETDGTFSSPASEWPCRTAFLHRALPITEYSSDKLIVRVVACPPVSADGSERPRAMIWGIHLRNCSDSKLSGTVQLTFPEKLLIRNVHGQSVVDGKIAYGLEPEEDVWLPLHIAHEGDEAALTALAKRDDWDWLRETTAYWNRVTGDFSIDSDPFTAELFDRVAILSLQTPCFDQQGKAAGVSYGSYPIGEMENFRDSYYAILPAMQRDPALLSAFIHWFADYAIHPGDTEHNFPGAVTHSLGNSLNAVMLSGLYYEATGDHSFFLENPDMVNTMRDILEQVLATRKVEGPWLFPSLYISDGKSLGDYHTGSNVCAWRSFRSFARISEDVLGDKETAHRYRIIAEKIKIDIDKHTILPGPFGPQYVEGVDADGTVPVRIHDGEESDTTLMPFYGYLSGAAPAYQNFIRFAMSPYNVAYAPETLGIIWEEYGENPKVKPLGGRMADATFPGYITALAGCTDKGGLPLHGKDGYLDEIRRLTDVNGTFWWWPYKVGAKRGQVKRGPFECGWAEGLFPMLFMANFLGIAYDAPTHAFRFTPDAAIGDFKWVEFPFGNDCFSISRQQEILTFANHSAQPISLIVEDSAPVSVPVGGTVTRSTSRQA